MPFYCDICWADFLFVHLAKPHFKSIAHTSAEKLKTNLLIGLNKDSFFCDVCMVTVTSKETLDIHLASNKHTLRLIQRAKILDQRNVYKAVTKEMLENVICKSLTCLEISSILPGNRII